MSSPRWWPLLAAWLAVLGCVRAAPQPPPQVIIEAADPHADVADAGVAEADDEADATEAADAEDEVAEDEEASESAEAIEEEGESRTADELAADAVRYTLEITDEMLAEHWKNTPEKLGSISIGFADEGRLINAARFPEGEAWRVVSPERAWATQETIDYVTTAIRKVKEQYPDAPPLRVNNISGPEGGYLRPHRSHQNGRDVDLAFYYPTADPIRVRAREKYIDVPKNWALVKALVTHTDVGLILVDRRIQKVLYDHALKSGEDKAWLDSIFKNGRDSIVKHARRHRDHFHVRFFNPKAQELGRRVAPLLVQRPEQNIVVHRVRPGDTLGAIARKYNTTVALIRKTNRLQGSFLRVRQVLRIPLRGPCTRCPVPPPAIVPPRRLPPAAQTAAAPTEPAATLPVDAPTHTERTSGAQP